MKNRNDWKRYAHNPMRDVDPWAGRKIDEALKEAKKAGKVSRKAAKNIDL